MSLAPTSLCPAFEHLNGHTIRTSSTSRTICCLHGICWRPQVNCRIDVLLKYGNHCVADTVVVSLDDITTVVLINFKNIESVHMMQWCAKSSSLLWSATSFLMFRAECNVHCTLYTRPISRCKTRHTHNSWSTRNKHISVWTKIACNKKYYYNNRSL